MADGDDVVEHQSELAPCWIDPLQVDLATFAHFPLGRVGEVNADDIDSRILDFLEDVPDLVYVFVVVGRVPFVLNQECAS